VGVYGKVAVYNSVSKGIGLVNLLMMSMCVAHPTQALSEDHEQTLQKINIHLNIFSFQCLYGKLAMVFKEHEYYNHGNIAV